MTNDLNASLLILNSISRVGYSSDMQAALCAFLSAVLIASVTSIPIPYTASDFTSEAALGVDTVNGTLSVSGATA